MLLVPTPLAWEVIVVQTFQAFGEISPSSHNITRFNSHDAPSTIPQT
jgi:hypothetical protein